VSLERALARAMETNPDARFASALEFAEALVAPSPEPGSILGKLKEKLT
jgi:hypothetical protein